jgi:hypothetical protein
MARIMYTPVPGDNATAQVGRFTFEAYLPIDVPDVEGELIQKLARNPWFHRIADSGDIPAEVMARQATWDAASSARSEASAARARADELDKQAIEADRERQRLLADAKRRAEAEAKAKVEAGAAAAAEAERQRKDQEAAAEAARQAESNPAPESVH